MTNPARFLIAAGLVFFLGACTSAQKGAAPVMTLGYLPEGLKVEERMQVPGLTVAQAKRKGLNGVDLIHQVNPPSELLVLDTCSGMRAFDLAGSSSKLSRDFSPGWTKTAASLRELLLHEPKVLDHSPPEKPFPNASLYVRARLRYLTTPWGKVMFMLGQYSQEAHPPPPNNDWLVIWFQGLSNKALQDKGGWYLSGRIRVKHPKLLSVEAAYKHEDKIGIKAGEALLESYPDDSFRPRLDEVEEMLRELRLHAN